MNYAFPKITHINQVINAIKGKDEFIVVDKDGDYTVVNYVITYDNTFPTVVTENDAILRECRGLIFKTSTGEIIRRPFHKFFNVGQREETFSTNLDFAQPHTVYTKLDGTFISCFMDSSGLRFGTKMGVTDAGLQAEKFVETQQNYVGFAQWCIANALTPTFEYTAPNNRIVIAYTNEQLTLLAIRHIVSGEYVSLAESTVAKKIQEFAIPTVKSHNSVVDVDVFIATTKELTGEEGYVVCWENGHRVKIKADEYCLFHKTKDAISQEKNVIRIIATRKLDDILPALPPEEVDNLTAFEHKFWNGVSNTVHELEVIYSLGSHIESQREFATEFVQKQDAKWASSLYRLRSGEHPLEVISEVIAKNCGSLTKVNGVRWMFDCRFLCQSNE